MESGAGAKLEDAAGIGPGDGLGAGGADCLHLLPEDLSSHLPVRHVVDAGAPAAEVRGRHLPERQTWNRCQQLARRGANPLLAVREVAGVLVGGGKRQPAHPGIEPEFGQELVDVPDQLREARRRPGVSIVVAQQLAVLLQSGPAARGVGDHGVILAGEHRVDVAPKAPVY
jgi:hypothetical protein